MSQWNLLDRLWKASREYFLVVGDSWDISYNFNSEGGSKENPNINYLVFTFGEEEKIHPTYRKVNVIDLDNQIINLRISTLVNPTIDTLGNEVSENIVNSDFNRDNDFDFKFYDETSTLSDEGTKVPFSNTLRAERKSISTEFIDREYIAPINGIIAIKFANYGSGEVRIEYSSGGHRIKII
ncbi:MAG: hypothetical protein ACOC1O_04465 [bacterium]